MSIHVHYNKKNKQNIGNHALKIDMNYFEMQQWDNRGTIHGIGNGKRSYPAIVTVNVFRIRVNRDLTLCWFTGSF